MVVLGPPLNTREGLRSAGNNTPQMAAYMPKCGGNPASVVEKAIAWGSVTTASVSPTSRLPRSNASMRGKALAIAFVGTGLIVGIVRDVFASERLGVPRQGWHDGHHELLPRGHQRTLLVAGRSRQGAEVVRDVAALLIVEATFVSQRHVAADEPWHDRIDGREI